MEIFAGRKADFGIALKFLKRFTVCTLALNYGQAQNGIIQYIRSEF